jgi:hypothetical protein
MYSAVADTLGPCDRRATVPPAPPSAARLSTRAGVSRAAALRRGALRVRLRSTEAGTVRVSALRSTVRLAGRTVRLQAGRARWVDVPLTTAGRRALRRQRQLAVRLVAHGAGAGRVEQRVVLR